VKCIYCTVSRCDNVLSPLIHNTIQNKLIETPTHLLTEINTPHRLLSYGYFKLTYPLAGVATLTDEGQFTAGPPEPVTTGAGHYIVEKTPTYNDQQYVT